MAPPAQPMAVDPAGIPLRNPVLLAAGTAGTLDETLRVVRLDRIGGLITKSITAEPREGNRAWRVAPVKAGMMNAIGLANPGLERFMSDDAPRIPALPCAVIGSIAGFSIEGYAAVAEAFDTIEAMPAVELNVSCPNVRHGVEFGADPALLGDLVRAVRGKLQHTRLLVKLPPAAVPTPHSIVDLAAAAVHAGADALSLCNTTPALAIDVRTRRPKLGNGAGGLSGPAVHQIAVKLVRDVHAALPGVPLVGIGGVLAWDDAAELILAGASAVQIGTGLFVDLKTPEKVVRGLDRWRRSQNAAAISELVGAMHPG